ncbi:hypothetical protein DL771_008110 [Monosporascus sp. 5C6A]|nr:hypothetical protein DL771_008110 [Monosporascus sp. 5C6A]
MEQTKALNALEPFLALSKSATSPRAAADLVTQATSNPNTYVFAELLQTPQIQALSQAPEYASHLRLLEIFSYGTYETYTGTPGLPALNDSQMLKLRQLSLLTLARDPQHGLGYATLLASLGLPDARRLEDLVISAVYADLLAAQLDPRNQTVHVSSVSPLRDLAPGSVPAILTQLRAWSGRCAETLSDLEAQIAAVRAGAAARHAEKKARDAAQARLVEQASKAGAGNDSRQGGPGVHGRGQNNLLSRAVAQLRGGGHRGKRGSVEANVGEDDDDELMEIDDDDAYEEGEAGGSGSGGGGAGGSNGGGGGQGKKRTSRRKL